MALHPTPHPSADADKRTAAISDESEAYHLLRRTTYAVTPARVDEAVGLGLDATLDRLFDAADELPDPINAGEPADPNVGIGATWIDAPLSDSRDPQRLPHQLAARLDRALGLPRGLLPARQADDVLAQPLRLHPGRRRARLTSTTSRC